MKNVKNFEQFIFENTNNFHFTQDQKRIIDDILSINEGFNFNKIISKIKNYGKKGALTLAMVILISLSVSAQSSEQSKDIIETGIEYVEETTTDDVIHAIIGFAKSIMSESMKDGQIEMASGFKEVSILYQQIRDNEPKITLSKKGKAALESIKKEIQYIIDNGEGEEILTQMIRDGKSIENLY